MCIGNHVLKKLGKGMSAGDEKKNKEREQNRELEMKLLIELEFKLGFVLLVPIFHFLVPCARFHPLNPKIKI